VRSTIQEKDSKLGAYSTEISEKSAKLSDKDAKLEELSNKVRFCLLNLSVSLSTRVKRIVVPEVQQL
jgi:hypothetical protein